MQHEQRTSTDHGGEREEENQSSWTYNVTFTIQLTVSPLKLLQESAHGRLCTDPVQNPGGGGVGGDNTVPFTKIKNAHTFGMAFHS